MYLRCIKLKTSENVVFCKKTVQKFDFVWYESPMLPRQSFISGFLCYRWLPFPYHSPETGDWFYFKSSNVKRKMQLISTLAIGDTLLINKIINVLIL